MGSEESSLFNWEYNLDFLKDHYDEILKIQGIDKDCVDFYIEEYEAQRECENLPKTQKPAQTRTSNYNYSAAVAYFLTEMRRLFENTLIMYLMRMKLIELTTRKKCVLKE